MFTHSLHKRFLMVVACSSDVRARPIALRLIALLCPLGIVKILCSAERFDLDETWPCERDGQTVRRSSEYGLLPFGPWTLAVEFIRRYVCVAVEISDAKHE
jgi:hypothetical protein